MRKRYIVILLAILIAFNIAAFLILRDIYIRTDQHIEQALNIYKATDDQKTAEMIANAIKEVQVIQGPQGQPGAPGVNGANGQDAQSIKGDKGDAGAPGSEGKNGKDGKDGKNGRQVILSTDPNTGDILWKYDGDTLWSLLVEKCELVKCEEQK